MPNSCQEKVLSNDYYDFLLEYSAYRDTILRDFPNACIQTINNKINIAYLNRNDVPSLYSSAYGYDNIPNLYAPMDTSALESSGIIKASEQPILNLRGQGVIIGFADTGIDYTHPAFLDANGKSRIAAIWDQTIQDGPTPEGFLYGSEYTQEMINSALESENPLSIVPSQDTDGHGTALAGVAAGSTIALEQFRGAAPESIIAMVKLKPAKQYLKDYYFVSPNAIAWQENDILTAVKYLRNLQATLNLPLVICLGLGGNQGGHSGCGVLNEYLANVGESYRTAVVVPMGNEASRFHHYQGFLPSVGAYEDVEFLVNENNIGFTAELWSSLPEIYSVGIISPSGEVVERTSTRPIQTIQLSFLLEETLIYLDYSMVTCEAGSQVIQMRFQRPAPGVWRIRVYKVQNGEGNYHIWLPVESFLSSQTIFLKPEIDTTLTSPAGANRVISTAAYNHRNGSLYLNSGHGYTRLGDIKPTISAPGVDITAPVPNGTFGLRSGTSIAAGITAGAAANLFTWGITRGNMPYLTGSLVQFFLISGAKRNPSLQYPNKEWGYGTLDLFNVFEVLRTI